MLMPPFLSHSHHYFAHKMSANPGDFVVMNDIRKREDDKPADGANWEDKKAGNRSLNGEEVSGTYSGARETSHSNPDQEIQQENKDLLLELEG